MRFSAQRAVVACLWAILFAACNGGPDSPLSPSDLPSLNLDDLVSAVSVADIQGVSANGPAPAPSGGPVITVTGNQTVVNGGTMAVALTSAAPFQTVYMFAGSRTLGLTTDAPGGIDGYYRVGLPSAQSSATALLSFPQSVPMREFELLFAVADASGVIGPFARLSTSVTEVGTGDVQVTLSWNTDSDVDIHVIDPRGEEIYYENPRSASGGELDLDSNAGCQIDRIRNENITWPIGRAPRGPYTVRVDYWSNCGVTQTNYTVRINNGGTVQIFTGTFTGAGDQGGRGSGRLITTFERLTGPTAQAVSGASSARSGAPFFTTGKTAVGPPR